MFIVSFVSVLFISFLLSALTFFLLSCCLLFFFPPCLPCFASLPPSFIPSFLPSSLAPLLPPSLPFFLSSKLLPCFLASFHSFIHTVCLSVCQLSLFCLFQPATPFHFSSLSLCHSFILFFSLYKECIVLECKFQCAGLGCLLLTSLYHQVIILDVRVPCTPVARLNNHRACVNGIAWAPHSSCHICTAGKAQEKKFIQGFEFHSVQLHFSPLSMFYGNKV